MLLLIGIAVGVALARAKTELNSRFLLFENLLQMDQQEQTKIQAWIDRLVLAAKSA